jgi:hypothetical protein
MDQRSICLFLDKQGFSATDTNGQLIAVLGSDEIASSIVTKYLTGMRCTAHREVNPKLENSYVIDQAILAALDEHLFSPVRDLAKKTCISPTMGWRRLTNSIGFVLKYLYLISYKFNNAQLAARV